MRDQIYTTAMGEIPAFQFDEEVTRVFPDMIARSVPGYAATLSAAGALAARFAQPHSRLYELGCSRGATLLSMARALNPEIPFTLVGVDTSEAMLTACRSDLEGSGHVNHPLELLRRDIRDVELYDASVVVLNFTLQFIPIADRLPLLKRVFNALRPGGVLLLSEKVHLDDPTIDQLCIDLHHNFKKSQGYSELEIARKRDALIDVLIPETQSAHRERLKEAGFSACEVWYQAFNFCSWVALS